MFLFYIFIYNTLYVLFNIYIHNIYIYGLKLDLKTRYFVQGDKNNKITLVFIDQEMKNYSYFSNVGA